MYCVYWACPGCWETAPTFFFFFLDLFTFASENCRDVGEDPPTHVMQG
jgi:hypothetical protein